MIRRILTITLGSLAPPLFLGMIMAVLAVVEAILHG